MYNFLIVDDEKMARDTIKLLIQRKKLPLRIIEAKSGRQAIEIYKKEKIDFIFLDIKMPGMDGIEAGKIIKEFDENALIIYLTAFNSFDYAKEAIQIGVKDYLVKPVEFDDIYESLNKLMKIVDNRKKEKKERDEKLRAVINQFSRSFFASLKFDRVEESLLYSYFDLKRDKPIYAVPIVLSCINKNNLEQLLKRKEFNRCRIYYFDSVDRYTLIIFSKDVSSVISTFKTSYFSFPVTFGIGSVFTSLSLIGTSIRQASISYSIACNTNKIYHEYNIGDEEFFNGKSNLLYLKEIEDAIINCDIVLARKKAHELTDKERNSNEIQSYYESILVLKHYLDNKIKYLRLPKFSLADFGQMETYLMDLIDICVNSLKTDKIDKWKRAFEVVDEYIKINYSKNLSLDYMASQLGINEKYFSKLFKQYFNQRYIDYLTTIRMENASKFLLKGFSVNKVSILTGYKDAAYFSKVFQQYFKINPSNYFEKIKKNNLSIN